MSISQKPSRSGMVVCAALLTIALATCVGSLSAQPPSEGSSVLLPPGSGGLLHLPAPQPTDPPAYPVTPEPVPTLPTPNEALSDMAHDPEFDSLLSDDSVEDGALLDGEPINADPTWYAYPVYWLGTIPWDTGIELGVNGAQGSNQSTSVRTGGYIKRESEFSKIDISAYYNRTSASGILSQHNAQLDVRNDWLFSKNSVWSLFGAGTLFYDELQVFDLQVNANGGVGYKFVDTGNTDLTTRVGFGGSREFGGPDNEWTPEGLLGLDLDHKIGTNQKLYASWEYFPELEEFEGYRLVTDVGWEVELVRPSNMSLKLSLTDRYDSTPNGVDPELLNYSALILWKL